LVIAGFHLQSSHLGFDDRWEMDMLAVTIFFALAATMLLNDFYDREADYKKGKDLAWKHPKFIRTFSLPQNPLE